MRQSVSADVSINSSLPNAEVTTIMTLQVISMRSSRNAEVKKQIPRARMSFKSDEKQVLRVRMSFKSKKSCEFGLLSNEKIPRVRVTSFCLKITSSGRSSLEEIEKDPVFG